MREIRFRSWNTEEGYMYDGVQSIDDYGGIDDIIETRIDEGWIIMQYTGLKDKNGTPIFEGDIVRGIAPYKVGWVTGEELYENRLVEWDGKMSGWSPFNYFTTNGANDLEDMYYELDSCEVIGNRYQNPELINSENAK